jgi:hypothetical protein
VLLMAGDTSMAFVPGLVEVADGMRAFTGA